MADQNWNFVIAAYGVSWLVLATYALYVHRRIRRARAMYERTMPSTGRGR